MLGKILESRKIVLFLTFVALYPVFAIAAGFVEGRYNPVVGEFSYSSLENKQANITTYDENYNTVFSTSGHIEFTTKNKTYRECTLKSVKWRKSRNLIYDVTFSDSVSYWRVSGIKSPAEGKMIISHKCHPFFTTITTIKRFKYEG